MPRRYDSDPGLVECALLLVLIAIVVIGVLTLLGGGTVGYNPCPPGLNWSTAARACM